MAEEILITKSLPEDVICIMKGYTDSLLIVFIEWDNDEAWK